MFRNLTVRIKLLTIVGAVAFLFGATVVALELMARQQLVSSMQEEIERSGEVASEFLRSRFRQLDAGLHSLVDSPEIRAVLTTEGIDHDTQLMSIVDLQHVLGADAVLYCDAKGKTLARTDDPFDSESMVDGIPLVRDALAGEVAKGFWTLEGKHLLTIAFPVTLDGHVEGVVMAGLDVSQDAKQLSQLMLHDVALRYQADVVSSSLDSSDEESTRTPADLAGLPAITAESLTSAASVAELPRRTYAAEGGNVEAIATTVAVAPEEVASLDAVVFVPVQSVYGFYRSFQKTLLFMGAITVGLSVAVTFCIGAGIASQVKKTLRTLEKVAEGDLSVRMETKSRDEFGRIAGSLNKAIQASADTLDALAQRNRDTRMLLDAVEQGFFTIDAQGRMSEERSGAVDRLFGTPRPGMTFAEFVAQSDPKVAGWIEMGLEDVFAEILPVEVTVDQLPKRFVKDDRTFSIVYTPVRIDDKLTSLAVVLSDITHFVANEKLEALQREMLATVQRVADDRAGFLEFFREADEIVDALKNEPHDDLALVKRRVHTLKGNAAIYGLERPANLCHAMEDFIAENGSLPPHEAWVALFATWDSVRANVRRIVGDDSPSVELSHEEYAGMLDDIISAKSHEELAIRMASWKLESTKVRMNRVGEMARNVACRLGKPDLRVFARGGNLRTEPGSWSDFWSSFVHVVRNAVDHGIETPEERRAAGKPETGRLEIATSIEGESFVVSLSDDGAGVNWERVAEIAAAKGLPHATREDLIQALFADGLSTAKQVTDTSGRGVGMGAVKESCERLGGRIEIESAKGEGTVFRFVFPIEAMAPEMTELLVLNEAREIQRLLVDARESAEDLQFASVTC